MHPAKSDFHPKPRRVHLGLQIDTANRCFTVPAPKHAALLGQAWQLAHFAASHKRWVSKVALARFCGTAISLAAAIPAGRFHLLPLYDALAQVESWAPTVMVRLSNAAYRQLRNFWTHLPLADCSVAWDVCAPDELLFTDSSDWAWGAHLGQDIYRSGAFSPEDAQRHITFKELKAVALALEVLGPLLTVKSLAVFSDSSTTVAILQKLYTKSPKLRGLLGRIIALTKAYGLHLQVHHIAGVANEVADILSRTVYHNSFLLDSAVV